MLIYYQSYSQPVKVIVFVQTSPDLPSPFATLEGKRRCYRIVIDGLWALEMSLSILGEATQTLTRWKCLNSFQNPKLVEELDCNLFSFQHHLWILG